MNHIPSKPSRKLFQNRSSTRQFLLYKTDAHWMDETIGKMTPECSQELSGAFPEILCGEDFIHQAMAWLEPAFKFSAMVVRIDRPNDPADESDNVSLADNLIRAASIVQKICQTENGLWGGLGDDMLGCYFADLTSSAALEFAQKIQQQFRASGQETASLGIADYPCLHFHKNQILHNALKALDHAAFFGPGSIVAFDAVSLNISGDVCYERGDVHGAIKEYKDGLLLDASNTNLHNSLGVCYGVLGEFHSALEEFQNAARLAPDEAMPVYNLGMVKLLSGDSSAALDFLFKAQDLGKDISEISFQIGRVYFEQQQFKTATDYFEKAIRLNPESNPAFRYLGECRIRLDQTDAADQALKKAVKLNAQDAAALSALGYLYFTQGKDFDIAQAFCEQSVQIEPQEGLFRYRLGRLYLGRELMQQALKEFEAAQELGHESRTDIQQVQARLSRPDVSGRKDQADLPYISPEQYQSRRN